MGRFHRHDDAHDHHHHGDHSGYATGTERVAVLERIFDENDHAAHHNREHLDQASVFALNCTLLVWKVIVPVAAVAVTPLV